MPAVLTENLFIDVASDAGRLKRSEVIDAIIQGHVSGIAKYLGLKRREGATVAKAPDWKDKGREWLIKNAEISPDWKATDPVDVGTLGTILSRFIK